MSSDASVSTGRSQLRANPDDAVRTMVYLLGVPSPRATSSAWRQPKMGGASHPVTMRDSTTMAAL
jgi:hypothetical protein